MIAGCTELYWRLTFIVAGLVEHFGFGQGIAAVSNVLPLQYSFIETKERIWYLTILTILAILFIMTFLIV